MTLTWFDQDINELGFVVERQMVVPGQPLQPFAIIAYLGSPFAGFPTGGINWTDGAALPACPADVVTNVPGTAGCYTANWVALQPGTTYNYQISSYNNFAISPPDLPVAATTLGPPNAPSGLAAVAVPVAPASVRVDLTWTDNSNNETGFTIQRATDAGFTAGLASFTVGANVTVYGDTTVAPTTTYFYRVSASNANGTSLPSNTASVTTPNVPPLAPSGLTATASDPAPTPPTVTLRWTDNANNENGFTIQRATNAGFTAGLTTFTINTPNTTTFTDTTVAPVMTYYYRVRAFNGAGFSAWSN